jgi:hypothetical protein
MNGHRRFELDPCVQTPITTIRENKGAPLMMFCNTLGTPPHSKISGDSALASGAQPNPRRSTKAAAAY